MTADAANPFDRRAVRRHRARAAADFARHDFLFREIAARLAERLDELHRAFYCALDLGDRMGRLRDALEGHGRIARLVTSEVTPGANDPHPTVIADEELLPFAPASFDLVASSLSLHWIGDLPGALVQIRRALRPDGLFLAAMFGGETLGELREALIEAETEAEGGLSPRLSPFVDIRDAGALLQRAGFAMPVVDCDTITVTYANALALMRDLRGMGETNAGRERRRSFSRRATLLGAAARYAARHAGEDGRIPATFQVLYLTGWAPHETQPKALRPGSARNRLADALDTVERPAGEKAGGGN